MANIAVLGSGTWGSALAVLLANNGHKVTIWSTKKEKAESLKNTRKNPMLEGVTFPDGIDFTADLESAVSGKEVIVLACASPFIRDMARKLKPLMTDEQIIVNVAKGVEDDTLKFPDEQIRDEVPGVRVAVLSGPSHAEEVGRGIPTTCVIGAPDEATAEYLQDIFMSPVFRVYTSCDIVGIELGGAIKNVIALAAGMADGLGYGDNTKAALITRGLAEITRLGTAMGAKAETLYGLAGIGDLIVTCASMHSRNRRAGILIGQGKSLDEALAEVGMVVEGVNSAKAVKLLADKYGKELPITNEVNLILFEGKAPSQAIKDLMLRDKRAENKKLGWS